MASSTPSWSLPPPAILQQASTFQQRSQNQDDLSSSATKGPCPWGSRSTLLTGGTEQLRAVAIPLPWAGSKEGGRKGKGKEEEKLFLGKLNWTSDLQGLHFVLVIMN